MSRIKFAIIADDNTGATDAAGMLTGKGVKTCLINDFSSITNVDFLADYKALVLGTQSRSVSAQEATEITRNALSFLDRFSPEIIQIKYCSTFDSTTEGNIGQFLDAAKEYSGQKSIVVCPALPINGRTTYMGHHFVYGELLSDSPLSKHPLNPMTDANLVRWLSHQTNKKVGLLSVDIISKGVEAVEEHIAKLEAEGISYYISDAITQQDIKITMQALRHNKIISGGSGITAEIPDLMFKENSSLCFDEQIANLPKGMLVLSGSMSPITKEQNQKALSSGLFEGFEIDPLAIIKDEYSINTAVEEIAKKISTGKSLLIYSPYESKVKVHTAADAIGISHTDAGIKIANALADIGTQMVSKYKVGKMLIAGGETTGFVCSKLKINELDIGLPLDPGVPFCFPINNPELLLVLKSGNFGSVDLYEKVLKL